MHLDINAFFASCHQAANPTLANRPIVVCHNAVKGIVLSASYEARSAGIKSAMPIFQAFQLLPNLVMIKPKRGLYEFYSKQVMSTIKSYYPNIKLEQASIDECFLDITNIVSSTQTPLAIAKTLQKLLLQKLSLPCSIGISYNRFLAKMGSNLQKPLGISLLNQVNLKQSLWKLPIRAMHGIGKQTAPLLIRNHILTIGDLALYRDNFIVDENFKKHDILNWKLLAQGHSGDNVVSDNYAQPKSIGLQNTLLQPTGNYKELKKQLSILLQQLCSKAQVQHVASRTIQIELKYIRGNFLNVQTKIPFYTNEYSKLWNLFLDLFDKNWDNQPVLLMRLSFKNLRVNYWPSIEQRSLFDQELELSGPEVKALEIVHSINKQKLKKILRTAKK